jgi:filamentous hemagglutinin family protein
MNRWRALLFTTSALVPMGLASALAGPNGATVAAGSASVSGQGTGNVVVNQSTQNAIINWNTFNIGAGETTTIVMPSKSSTELDRVTGGLGPSQILGSLTSNGQVFLVNPDGILFGKGAEVNTGSFLATTHDIANSDFMAGRYNFTGLGNPAASIVNQGSITAQTGGFAALVAPGVRNTGIITAKLGTVALAAGNAFTLDFYGDNLITLGVNDSIASQVIDVSTGQPLKSLVSNEGTLKANGGRVELTAVAARVVVDSVINNSGVIEANSIGTHNGMIVLQAATAANKPAGAPTQTVKVSGTLSAAGKRKGTTGGTIEVTGENVQVAAATINASGRSGGGTVLIGGDWSGGNPNTSLVSNPSAYVQPYAVPTASTVSIDAATTINASATTSGNGGKVIVWADQATTFAGTIFARGGASAGDGGFVETSGHQQLNFNGTVDTSAPNGARGTLLLDPQDVTIGSSGTWIVSVANLQNALASGNVIVATGSGSGNGDITVAQSVNWNNASALTLSAYRNIAVNANLTSTGGGAVNLHADNTGIGTGTVTFGNGATVSTSGAVSIFYDPTSYSSPTNYAGNVIGGGIVNAYMLVNTVGDLQNVQNNLSGTYALGANINAGGAVVAPIGDENHSFQGLFDGQGHTINGLTITSTGIFVGLFAYIAADGTVRNVGLTNLSVNAPLGYDVGGLVGRNLGTISGSFTTGSVSGAAGNNIPGLVGIAVGGLAGWNFGTITNSYSTAFVTSPTTIDVYLGGLSGGNTGTIAQSYASGTVSGRSGPVEFGGLVGSLGYIDGSSGTITQSYATGAVIAPGNDAAAGGLVGGMSNSSRISQSYATGAVTGGSSSWIGGLVGVQFNGTITRSFATGSATVGADGVAGGLVGQMSAGSIFQSYATGAATAGNSGAAGGLVGVTYGGAITQTYAIGAVSAGSPFGIAGGLTGENGGALISSSYWDTQTTPQLSNGITFGGVNGAVGQTTTQLKAGLPAGFDASVWAINAGVNSGFPFLYGFIVGPTTGATSFATTLPPTQTTALDQTANYSATFGQNTWTTAINTTVAGSTQPVISNLSVITSSSNNSTTTAQGLQFNPPNVKQVTPTNDQGSILSVNPTPLVVPDSTNAGAITGTLTIQFPEGSKATVTAYSNGSNEGRANGNEAYQCSALIVRYANQLGITGLLSDYSNVLDGKDVAQQLASVSNGKFNYVPNGSPELPEVGAVISIGGFNTPDKNGNTDPAGHVGIVQSVTANANGTVTLTLFDQNWPSGDHWSQVTLTKQGNSWFGTMKDSNAPGGELTVVGWANPVGL